jgi:hypothetical protein
MAERRFAAVVVRNGEPYLDQLSVRGLESSLL